MRYSYCFLAALAFSANCIAEETLSVESTTIIGNNEQPKALFIMPWHQPEHTAGLDQPVQSLVEQTLSPLDRDEFRRRMQFQQDLQRYNKTSMTTPSE